MLLRRPLRWLLRLALLLTFFSLIVFYYDVKYDVLPSAIQDRLFLHPNDPVITDIEIRQCGWLNRCEKLVSKTKFRIDKDLFINKTWLSPKAFVYVTRKNETLLEPNDLVVLNLAVGQFDLLNANSRLPKPIVEDLKSTGVSDLVLSDAKQALNASLHSGWNLENENFGFWVKRGKHVPNQAVSDLKVFYGEDVEYPLDGWQLTDVMMVHASNLVKNAEYGPRFAVKIGRTVSGGSESSNEDLNSHRTNLPPLVAKNNQVKIVQLADLHMCTGYGRCYDPAFDANNCIADKRTREFVDLVLDTEKPDFVVFSGDQIYGEQSPDQETALLKAIAPVINHKIPWAMVWGNHDDDGVMDRQKLFQFAKTLPYGYLISPDNDASLQSSLVSGVGNFWVEIQSANHRYPALSMYFLDSHSKFRSAKMKGYEFIDSSQQEWLKRVHNQQLLKLKGYPKLPLSLAFFHIPLPEYRNFGPQLAVGGQFREGVVAPLHNSGTLAVLQEIGVSVVSVGHDHVNDFCTHAPEASAESHFTWLCYGGGAGFGGYGGFPWEDGVYKRRVRVFDINLDVPSVKTWHRVENSAEIHNEMLLVNNGVSQ